MSQSVAVNVVSVAVICQVLLFVKYDKFSLPLSWLLSDEVLAWLSDWSEMQMICIWTS